MIKLIKEFLEFRRVMRIAPEMELVSHIDSYVRLQNFEKEIELNGFLIWELSKMMIREEVTPEFVRGFKCGLQLRTSLISRKPKMTGGIDK